MSQWRRKASETLPELQKTIASPEIDSPMMLWIELNVQFERLCEDSSPPVDLLRRIWNYGFWCLDQESQDVSTAAALGFFEHAIDNTSRVALLDQITTKSTLEGLRDLLKYHNTPEEIELAFKAIRK